MLVQDYRTPIEVPAKPRASWKCRVWWHTWREVEPGEVEHEKLTGWYNTLFYDNPVTQLISIRKDSDLERCACCGVFRLKQLNIFSRVIPLRKPAS